MRFDSKMAVSDQLLSVYFAQMYACQILSSNWTVKPYAEKAYQCAKNAFAITQTVETTASLLTQAGIISNRYDEPYHYVTNCLAKDPKSEFLLEQKKFLDAERKKRLNQR